MLDNLILIEGFYLSSTLLKVYLAKISKNNTFYFKFKI